MDNKLTFSVGKSCDRMKALTFLKKECGVSSRIITRLKREKNGILCNGKLLKTIDILHAGDTITLNLPLDENHIVPSQEPVCVLYEDSRLIVLDKPAGIPVHPTKIYQRDTLANRVAFYAARRGECYAFRAVSRLDKDTSGIVLAAKDPYTASMLPKSAEKVYYAVCQGKTPSDGVIDTPIKLQPGSSIRRITAPEGKHAVTRYQALKYGGGHTLVRLTLETGRTHQIRCHMSSIGHPLAGDDLYGGSAVRIERQALHCGEVSFLHPVTGEKHVVKSPVPQIFFDLLKGE